ncbi:CPBP family intramembrane glutamic endopeptidase [Halalkalibacter akibai]|uniref:CAAX prenyl protease 2/Lysostaphin resistance protein A-like domain-containing protein n=1 Tax=Halalkalibacter akibai (strain ATCC 43226 / DSM 21942 / CIP 109018 / JCM 9157 / 1139) TaxID=1236973 RepID=W4QQA1_HALA3|nr:CPBP family intramembrane glutamic endopeptidase [Halalkalibacter akibai]GAE33504.1 hypothetical protein JCM9157_508 [Halalkalibacter akibai JCM 9157]
MKQDRYFYIGILLALGLLTLSFNLTLNAFWTTFPIALSLLSIWSWIFEKHNITFPRISLITIALGTGLALYGLFALGKWFLLYNGIPLLTELETLYQLVQPTGFLNFLFLFVIIIPGEEWFWRGFIVKRLMNQTSDIHAALIGTLLYAGCHLVTGSLLLVLAALIAGLIWSFLYVKTNNIWVPIVSHVTFNLLLLILFPLI